MDVAGALDNDKAVDFVGMNSERGKTLIEQHGLDMNQSAYAFNSDGTRSEKSHFMRDVLAHGGSVGFILSLPFRVPILGDLLYSLLATIRYHITKS